MSRKLDEAERILLKFITIVHISTVLVLSAGGLLHEVLHLLSKMRQG